MKLADFDYKLPEELIAKYPLNKRSQSRLLYLNGKTGAIEHEIFKNILNHIQPNDLIVFNDTKVIPARLFGAKQSGGKVEVLIERVMDDKVALARIKASKAPRIGAHIILDDGTKINIIEKKDEFFKIEFQSDIAILELVNKIGHMPLPPYLDRQDEHMDFLRYQTIYAKKEGAVAAPTAGLHFDSELFAAIKKQNIATCEVTLHVGSGTFQPVRVDNIEAHKMHAESIEVSADVCQQIQATKAKAGRVIAVGTTTLRSLETAALSGEIKPFLGDSDIFIYPGFKFKCVDALITNFHLPKSTLLMLVAAFAGIDNIHRAYEIAIQEKYRFFSYGDAMFMTKKNYEI